MAVGVVQRRVDGVCRPQTSQYCTVEHQGLAAPPRTPWTRRNPSRASLGRGCWMRRPRASRRLWQATPGFAHSLSGPSGARGIRYDPALALQPLADGRVEARCADAGQQVVCPAKGRSWRGALTELVDRLRAELIDAATVEHAELRDNDGIGWDLQPVNKKIRARVVDLLFRRQNLLQVGKRCPRWSPLGAGSLPRRYSFCGAGGTRRDSGKGHRDLRPARALSGFEVAFRGSGRCRPRNRM